MSRQAEIFLEAFKTGYGITDRYKEKKATERKEKAIGEAYGALDKPIQGAAIDTPVSGAPAIDGVDPENQYVNVQTWQDMTSSQVQNMIDQGATGKDVREFRESASKHRAGLFKEHANKALALYDIDPQAAAKHLRVASSYNPDGAEWLPKVIEVEGKPQMVVGSRDDITGKATTEKPTILSKEQLGKYIATIQDGPEGLMAYDLTRMDVDKKSIDLKHLNDNYQLAQLDTVLKGETRLADAQKELSLLQGKLSSSLAGKASDYMGWEGKMNTFMKTQLEANPDLYAEGQQMQDVARTAAALGHMSGARLPFSEAVSISSYVTPVYDQATEAAKAHVAQQQGVNPQDVERIALTNGSIAQMINNTRMGMLIEEGVFRQNTKTGQMEMQAGANSTAFVPVPPYMLGKTPVPTFTGNAYSIMNKVSSGGYGNTEGMQDVVNRMRGVLGLPPSGGAAPTPAPQQGAIPQRPVAPQQQSPVPTQQQAATPQREPAPAIPVDTALAKGGTTRKPLADDSLPVLDKNKDVVNLRKAAGHGINKPGQRDFAQQRKDSKLRNMRTYSLTNGQEGKKPTVADMKEVVDHYALMPEERRWLQERLKAVENGR